MVTQMKKRNPAKRPRYLQKKPVDPATSYELKFGWPFESFLRQRLIPDLMESGDVETAKDFKTGLAILSRNLERSISSKLAFGKRDNIKKAVYFVNYLDNRYIPDLVDSGRLEMASDFKLLSRMIKHRVLDNRYSSGSRTTKRCRSSIARKIDRQFN